MNHTSLDCPIVFLDATYVSIKRAYNDTKAVEKERVLVSLGVTKTGQKKTQDLILAGLKV